MAISLTSHSYGKAGIHAVRVDRTGGRHRLRDLTVSTALSGDFADCYLHGDNSAVLPTDSQKNTVYAFLAEPFTDIEELALRLARHFTAELPAVRSAQVTVAERSWDPVEGVGAEHGAFRTASGESRFTEAVVGPDGERVAAGTEGLSLLKATGSSFAGFARDRYTTLPETEDRILATALWARWEYQGVPADWDKAYATVRAQLLEAFAETRSLALQQTLFAMGGRALAAVGELRSIHLRLPNLHHVAVDLTPFGLSGGHEVFAVPDRPYGVIEATVARTP